MNKYVFTLLALSLLLSACSIFESEHDSERIEGRWEWVQSTGGILGHTITPQTPGYSTRELRFFPGSQFDEYRADTLFQSGYYSFQYGKEGFELRFGLHREAYPETKDAEFDSGDRLILRDRCADCYTSTWRRAD